MQLPPLTMGYLQRRYKRFFADVVLPDGTTLVAHCPNTGSMQSCWEPGVPAQVSHNQNPKRKLRWTLERTDMGAGWIGVNTLRTNGVIIEGLREGRIPGLTGYRQLRPEVPYAPEGREAGRLDVALSEGHQADALVEIKNVTLLMGERLCFPDAVTQRGRKHLDLLIAAVESGRRGVLVLALNRPEGECFAPAWRQDPAYCERLVAAAAAGVEIIAVRIEHHGASLRTGALVPVVLTA